MKRFVLGLLLGGLAIAAIATTALANDVYVNGYTRSDGDGTNVPGHYRSALDASVTPVDGHVWNAGAILLGWVLIAGDVARPLAYIGIVMMLVALIFWAFSVQSYPDDTYADAVIVVSAATFIVLIIAGVVALFAAKGMRQ